MVRINFSPGSLPSHTSFSRVASLAAVITFLFPPIAVMAQGQRNISVITQAVQIRRLTPEQTQLKTPVLLRGVVTYNSPEWGLTFFQDSTAGVFIMTRGFTTKIRSGDLVEVRGVIGPGDFAPVVNNPEIRVLGRAPLPSANRFPLDDLLTGEEDSQWVEVRGIVRTVGLEDTVPPTMTKGAPSLVLGISAGNNEFKARIKEFQQGRNYASLLDSEVTIRGACGSLFNDKKQLVGIQLFVPNMDQVRIEKTSGPDPYALPIRTMASLMRFSLGKNSGHRVRVSGTVTLQRPGGGLFVRDQTDDIFVRTSQTDPLVPGDLVDVVGFPALGEFEPFLKDAIFRKVGHGPSPQPVDMKPEQAASGNFYSTLIRIKGRLLQFTSVPGDNTLVLQAGSVVFRAHLLKPRADDKLESLQNGSLLQLTGVCLLQTNINGGTPLFQIVLRSAQDIIVLEAAPWWTVRRIVGLLAILVCIISLSVAWVLVLHRRIDERTETIRATLDSTADGILVVDSAGKIATHNNKFAKMWDIPEPLLKSRDINIAFNSLLPQIIDPKEFLETIRPAGANQEAQIDSVVEFKDGRVFECHSEPQDVKGRSVGRVLGFRNVTDRKRAEQELERERHLLGALLDCSTDSIYFKDCESRFLRTSKSLARAFGLKDPLEAVGKTDFDFFTEEHARPAFEDEQKIIKTGQQLVGIEEKETWPDGRVTWCSTTKMPLLDIHGHIIGTMGISRDITDRKRVEETLRQSEAELKEAQRLGRLGSWQLVAKTGQVTWSEELYHMFGLDPKLPATPYHDQRRYFTPESWEQLGTTLAATLQTGVPWELELQMIRPDGSKGWMLARGEPARDENGAITGLCGIKQDITERKRAAEELLNAKQAAEAANRAKSEFLANMSHEIRTPMNGILGMTELILETELDREQREYLEMAKSSADSLLTVINDILDFSRMEACKFELDMIEFNLRDSLEQTMKAVALRAHQKGLELICDVRPEVPEMIMGDPTRLRQIIINLVGNAIKFTEKGEIVVRVDLDSHLEDGVGLHFEVLDTGIGIPQEKQKLIFGAFSQADGSVTRKYGGTGLGLTISKKLVEMMRGKIWVESEEGNGSSFHFTALFPLVKGTSPEPPLNDAILTGIRVLIVDDNATNRRILNDLLVRWQMKPTVADGGNSAIALLEQAEKLGQVFPLVLTDSHMLGMDGFTLAERIKRNPRLANATIMMLTSGGQRGDAVRCKELGISAYLTKPVRQAELREAILAVLASRPAKEHEQSLVTRHSLREMRHGLNILLAEDNVVSQRLVIRLLEKRGHTVVVAANGNEALAAIERSQPSEFDLVLMDVQMPELGGFEATAEIRKREELTGQHIPIVAMTAHAMKGDRERCLAAGMDGYISKPIQIEGLVAVIESVLPPLPAVQIERPQEAIDHTELLSRMNGDKKLLAELADLFFRDCPKHLGDIREAVERRDSKALEFAAHTLKGSMGNFAAEAACAAAQRLETMGRQGDLKDSEIVFQSLETEIENVKLSLDAITRGVHQ